MATRAPREKYRKMVSIKIGTGFPGLQGSRMRCRCYACPLYGSDHLRHVLTSSIIALQALGDDVAEHGEGFDNSEVDAERVTDDKYAVQAGKDDGEISVTRGRLPKESKMGVSIPDKLDTKSDNEIAKRSTDRVEDAEKHKQPPTEQDVARRPSALEGFPTGAAPPSEIKLASLGSRSIRKRALEGQLEELRNTHNRS